MKDQTKQEILDNYSLVKRLRKGERSAFEEVFYNFCTPLKHFAVQELKSEELAEDAVQEIFCKLWIKRESLEPTLSIKGFLFTCLKNHILNIIRTRKNEILKNYSFAKAQPQSFNSTEDTVISQEIQSRINQEVSQLSELKKNILELSIYKGLSNEQIANELDVSINTVKMYLSQSSRRLRQLISLHGIKLLFFSLLDIML
ncbi:RNA polymerase sigma-70 factor (family 1) [Catalinimonas alkaloidigena]|uniref:RNA polymerase sigma factor n=1 Tax=Catalinimonas alkaloidigena TaxID=1075417 RepID=UPI00240626BB|nr:sigma-70 family RNA polymerase sigma factor [Catalinimonas alkaloidigena]MDF9796573.1 RNA polymerase sigma-70 factor (family 1) [Catalinimonas alkaloidigena]